MNDVVPDLLDEKLHRAEGPTASRLTSNGWSVQAGTEHPEVSIRLGKFLPCDPTSCGAGGESAPVSIRLGKFLPCDLQSTGRVTLHPEFQSDSESSRLATSTRTRKVLAVPSFNPTRSASSKSTGGGAVGHGVIFGCARRCLPV